MSSSPHPIRTRPISCGSVFQPTSSVSHTMSYSGTHIPSSSHSSFTGLTPSSNSRPIFSNISVNPTPYSTYSANTACRPVPSNDVNPPAPLYRPFQQPLQKTSQPHKSFPPSHSMPDNSSTVQRPTSVPQNTTMFSTMDRKHNDSESFHTLGLQNPHNSKGVGLHALNHPSESHSNEIVATQDVSKLETSHVNQTFMKPRMPTQSPNYSHQTTNATCHSSSRLTGTFIKPFYS